MMQLVLLAWAAFALTHPPVVNDYEKGGKVVCVVGVKTDAPEVWVVQQNTAGHVQAFGVWRPGERLCARWGFTDTHVRFGYVVGADTTWGEPFPPDRRPR
jgi:hypothetical protein